MGAQELFEGARERVATFAKDLPLDKAVDVACAASCGASVIDAVRKAGSLAGKGTVRKALGVLGGSAGTVGGALSILGIALSTYVATDQLLVEAAVSAVDTLLAKGVDAGEVADIVSRLKVSSGLKEKLQERVRAFSPVIDIDCEVDEV